MNAEAVRAALGLAAGDSTEFDKEAAVARLRAVPGVVDAAVLTVLMPGNAVLLVGVEERGTPKLALNAAPTGDVRLPE